LGTRHGLVGEKTKPNKVLKTAKNVDTPTATWGSLNKFKKKNPLGAKKKKNQKMCNNPPTCPHQKPRDCHQLKPRPKGGVKHQKPSP